MWCFLWLACLEPDPNGNEDAGGAAGNPGFDVDAGIDDIPQDQNPEPDTAVVREPDDPGGPSGGRPAIDPGPADDRPALRPLGGSTIEGVVSVEIAATFVLARVDVEGLSPGALHAQRLHQAEGAACPSAADDTDGDGSIDAAELVAVAGPAVATFDPLLADHNGRFGWAGAAPADTDPQLGLVYVVYGAMRGDRFDPDAPAACAVVRSG